MQYPLEGIKVLDFSRVLAGPFAGRMLSDLGADVVKVEPPEGDVTRYFGRTIGKLSSYFNQQNAGKRNICIDLRAPGAAELVRSMVKQADIVIENYRPDVMGRLGIGYEQLKEANPKIIMLSISGFGHNGPESRRATYAPVVHAEAGLIRRMTARNKIEHHDLPLSVADTNAGLHGLVGVLSALYMRDKTGLGQHVDIAMIDATVATDDQVTYDLEGTRDDSLPNLIWELPFGPVILSTDIRLFFRLLNTQLGLEDPSTPEMGLEEKIAARREAIDGFLAQYQTIEAFTEAMKTINVAWGEVRDPQNLEQQATLKARGAIVHIDNRDGGTRPITQSPYRFSNAKSGVKGPAPHRGEHHREVLNDWLQMPDSDVDGLLSDGVLVFDPDWRPR
ncbi:MAG: CaiB/BaiF CoA-transferase family protein [Pseudomonadota bacterium]